MNDQTQIAYRYVGPATYHGLPANDLTHERVALLSLKLQAALKHGLDGYEQVKSAKTADTKEKGEVK